MSTINSHACHSKSVSENGEARRLTKAENTDEVSYRGRVIGMFSRKMSSGVVALPSKTAAGILSHRAEPSNLFGENGKPRNFQTGSNGPLGAIFCMAITLLNARADVALLAPTRGDLAGTSVEATFGWSFTVGTTSLQVSGLGIWDDGNNGLIGAHPVGLWNSSGTLLATTIVPAGTAAPLLGEYRFVSLLNPIVLSASETYVIGASYDNDDDLDHPLSALPEVSPHLSVLQARYLLESPFNFPVDAATSLPAAYIGPNFEFTVVPEPSSWSLASLGFCAFAIRALVKRRSG